METFLPQLSRAMWRNRIPIINANWPSLLAIVCHLFGIDPLCYVVHPISNKAAGQDHPSRVHYFSRHKGIHRKAIENFVTWMPSKTYSQTILIYNPRIGLCALIIAINASLAKANISNAYDSIFATTINSVPRLRVFRRHVLAFTQHRVIYLSLRLLFSPHIGSLPIPCNIVI